MLVARLWGSLDGEALFGRLTTVLKCEVNTLYAGGVVRVLRGVGE